MDKVKLLLAGLLVAGSLLSSTPVKACACRCVDLYVCMDKCKNYYSDPVLQNSCYGGCAIACWWHGNA